MHCGHGTCACATHALRAHRQQHPSFSLARQVDVRHDAALQLQDEIGTLQSKQGFHHTELIEFVNSNHHRISEELRGRERRFRRLEEAVLAALAAAGHATPPPGGKPPRASSLRVATPMHMHDSPWGSDPTSDPTSDPISLHELAEAVGEGADQVRESLALLAAEVSRGEAVQRDGYERRLRQAEAELLRVTRTRTDFMAHAQKAAQQGTEHMLQRLAKQLEQLGAAQDESVARLAEQSRHEKARLGTMRSAFSDELEQACAWCVHGMCTHIHTPTHAPPASPCGLPLWSGARATQCAGDLRRRCPRAVDHGRAGHGARQKRALQGTPHLDDHGAIPLAPALYVLGRVALARVGPPHRTHRASRVSRGAAGGCEAQEGPGSLREVTLRGACRGGR